MSDSFNIDLVQKRPFEVKFTEKQPFKIEFNSKSGGKIIDQNQLNKISLLFGYKIELDSAYSEYTFNAGVIDRIDIWEDATKTLKLFSRVFTFYAGLLEQVLTTDEINERTFTKTFTYSAGVLQTKTEVYS